jgi:hypothetical protein
MINLRFCGALVVFFLLVHRFFELHPNAWLREQAEKQLHSTNQEKSKCGSAIRFFVQANFSGKPSA